MSLWDTAKTAVGAVTGSQAGQDVSAALQTAAADRLALKIDDVFSADKALLSETSATIAPPDPELNKVRVPDPDKEIDAADTLPVWAIPVAVVVVAVLVVVAFFSRGKKGGKK